MTRRVIHPMPIAGAWRGAVVVSWLLLGLSAEAATARAELKDASGTRVGEASLQDTPDGVKVLATFSDLPPGEHAFHVHAIGRCEAPFESAGGHFNPTQRQHGRDNPQGAHAGDMPNIQVVERKTGSIDVVLKNVTLETGANRLLDSDGASLVVHERPDDYTTDPAGNAGARIACGVITPR